MYSVLHVKELIDKTKKGWDLFFLLFYFIIII